TTLYEPPPGGRTSDGGSTHVQPISPEKTTDRGRRPDAASAPRSVGAGVRGERSGTAAPGSRGDAQEDPGGGPGAAPPARSAEGRHAGDAEEGRRGRNQRPDGERGCQEGGLAPGLAQPHHRLRRRALPPRGLLPSAAREEGGGHGAQPGAHPRPA